MKTSKIIGLAIIFLIIGIGGHCLRHIYKVNNPSPPLKLAVHTQLAKNHKTKEKETTYSLDLPLIRGSSPVSVLTMCIENQLFVIAYSHDGRAIQMSQVYETIWNGTTHNDEVVPAVCQ